MNLNGWEHHDLEVEMRDRPLFVLLEIFKREDTKFNKRCEELLVLYNSMTEEGRKAKEQECHLQDEARCKVALKIANMLTKG